MADQPDINHADHYAKSSGGLFDIRNVIAALFAIYGVVLVITGIVSRSPAVLAKAGSNVNLWAGVAMIVVSLSFFAWSLLRPVAVPEREPTDDSR